MKKGLLYVLMLLLPPLVIVPVGLPIVVDGFGKGGYHGPGWLASFGFVMGVSLVINSLTVLLLERKAPSSEKIVDILLGFLFSSAGVMFGVVIYFVIAALFLMKNSGIQESMQASFLYL